MDAFQITVEYPEVATAVEVGFKGLHAKEAAMHSKEYLNNVVRWYLYDLNFDTRYCPCSECQGPALLEAHFSAYIAKRRAQCI